MAYSGLATYRTSPVVELRDWSAEIEDSVKSVSDVGKGSRDCGSPARKRPPGYGSNARIADSSNIWVKYFKYISKSV